MIGLIVHDVADPHFAAIGAGAMRAAWRRRMMIMIAATCRDPELEIEYVRSLRAQRAWAPAAAPTAASAVAASCRTPTCRTRAQPGRRPLMCHRRMQRGAPRALTQQQIRCNGMHETARFGGFASAIAHILTQGSNS